MQLVDSRTIPSHPPACSTSTARCDCAISWSVSGTFDTESCCCAFWRRQRAFSCDGKSYRDGHLTLPPRTGKSRRNVKLPKTVSILPPLTSAPQISHRSPCVHSFACEMMSNEKILLIKSQDFTAIIPKMVHSFNGPISPPHGGVPYACWCVLPTPWNCPSPLQPRGRGELEPVPSK